MEELQGGWEYVGVRPVGSVQEQMHVWVRYNGKHPEYEGRRFLASNPGGVLLKRCRDGSLVRADKLSGYQR